MAKVKVSFFVKLQSPMNTTDVIAKLKLDSSYGFFDEYEIINATNTYYEIIAYIDEFDTRHHIDKFDNNYNEYKSYIKSISNEFLRYEILYHTRLKDSLLTIEIVL